jgi:hypothetical protein
VLEDPPKLSLSTPLRQRQPKEPEISSEAIALDEDPGFQVDTHDDSFGCAVGVMAAAAGMIVLAFANRGHRISTFAIVMIAAIAILALGYGWTLAVATRRGGNRGLAFVYGMWLVVRAALIFTALANLGDILTR